MRPVGVGRASRGPIGVDGWTITDRQHALARRGRARAVRRAPCCACTRRSRSRDRAASTRRPAHRRRAARASRRCSCRRRARRRAVERGLHHVARADDVRLDDLVRVERPQPVVGRDVEDVPAAVDGTADRVAIAHVGLDEFDIGIVGEVDEVRRARTAADHRADREAVGPRAPHDRGADEAGGAGHEDGRRGGQAERIRSKGSSRRFDSRRSAHGFDERVDYRRSVVGYPFAACLFRWSTRMAERIRRVGRAADDVGLDRVCAPFATRR